mgnify:CR=1 FL=1
MVGYTVGLPAFVELVADKRRFVVAVTVAKQLVRVRQMRTRMTKIHSRLGAVQHRTKTMAATLKMSYVHKMVFRPRLFIQ